MAFADNGLPDSVTDHCDSGDDCGGLFLLGHWDSFLPVSWSAFFDETEGLADYKCAD